MTAIPSSSSSRQETASTAHINTNRWAYIKPNINLAKSIWNKSESVAAKIVLFVPALIVAIAEVLLKTPCIILIDAVRLVGNHLCCFTRPANKPAANAPATKSAPTTEPANTSSAGTTVSTTTEVVKKTLPATSSPAKETPSSAGTNPTETTVLFVPVKTNDQTTPTPTPSGDETTTKKNRS